MKKLAFAVILFATAALLPAADEKKTYEVETIRDVAYVEKDGDSQRNKLDCYLPKDAKNYPVLFFIHGGGWTRGDKKGFAAHGKAFAANGIGFVATNYRLSPKVKHPAHIEDVAKAFAWTTKNLGKHGADTKKLFVSGHSAGGHLAALLGSEEKYLKGVGCSLSDIKGVVPISGVFTIGGRLSDYFGDDESCKQASPQTHIRAGLPPFLLLYADKELGALGKQAESFGKAMQGLKCDCEVKMIRDRDHGTIMRNAAKTDDEAFGLIMAFIRKKAE